jgi:Fe2+ transport system protein B
MAHHCVVCGQTLEATDALFARLTTKTPEQIQRVREAGARIKAEEESAARARSAKMWAEEARRRKEEEDARLKRDRQERLIVGLALGLVAVAVVIAIVIAIVATSGNPAPVF